MEKLILQYGRDANTRVWYGFYNVYINPETGEQLAGSCFFNRSYAISSDDEYTDIGKATYRIRVIPKKTI